MEKVRIDRFTFFSSITFVLIVCIPLILFPEKGSNVIDALFEYTTNNLGFLNIWTGLIAFLIAIWFSFSKYGNIVFGKENEKPEFSNFSWASMLFCAGIGAGVMYWGSIEWVYYYMSPPFAMEPESWKAVEFAATYGIFHWGPIGWALYSLPALPLAYCYYVRKEHVFKISETLRVIIGNRADGLLGKFVDVLFIFGAIGATATSLGLGTPMIAAGISKLTGIPVNLELKLIALIIVTLIFSISAYSGLKKGIQVLSNINVYLMFAILIFIFITGPTMFFIKMGTTSMGILVQNFFRMSTWMDPVMNSGFPESWTVFYWAWWIISAPLLGLFIARISKGRTVRGVIMGSIIYGTLGCALMFIVLGNLGLHLQITNKLNVVQILNESGAPTAIMSVLSTLKFNKIIICLFSVVAIVFTATTFDSVSYILASVTSKKILENQEPAKWNRLFWAFTLAFLPATLLIIEGPLSTIQTTSIITSIPVIFILIAMVISFVKMVDQDLC
ncbi:BCCT family transporter [Oceanirhabdus sp. W0125-5]|uniref:BCCT family transporter n=1 Tax=Oceanirhabdus sp. W0125-5 TaxID=2999116 RepID=UPI0022F32F52|nr:BCCT family transporter [Oceanirhabdus sp. W0125-5]WBW97464.1 BCCT family transporter [Oceanirhabdus sp. W0125-5]